MDTGLGLRIRVSGCIQGLRGPICIVAVERVGSSILVASCWGPSKVAVGHVGSTALVASWWSLSKIAVESIGISILIASCWAASKVVVGSIGSTTLVAPCWGPSKVTVGGVRGIGGAVVVGSKGSVLVGWCSSSHGVVGGVGDAAVEGVAGAAVGGIRDAAVGGVGAAAVGGTVLVACRALCYAVRGMRGTPIPAAQGKRTCQSLSQSLSEPKPDSSKVSSRSPC